MMGFEKYAVTFHNRVEGRDVDITFWAHGFERATAKAWRRGNWENWEAATINGVRVEAPDDVAGREYFPRPYA